MRWLFLFLLLANVTYITWEVANPSNESVMKKITPADIPPLVLISELESPNSKVIPSDVKHENIVVAANKVKNSIISAKQALVEKNSIHDKSTIKTSKTASSAVVTKPKPLTDACYTLGPFRELNKLRVFTRNIKDYVVDVSFRSRDEQEISLFWVYLAPKSDLKATHTLSKKLIKHKIRDYYIIASGDKKNGISLGHFKDKKRASSHAKRLKKLGFHPIVEAVYKTYVIYWLDYKVAKGRQIPSDVFDKYKAERMNKLSRECVLAK